MAPIWSLQPFKTLYTAFIAAKVLTSLPWLLVRYGLRSARPFPEWSLKYTILNSVLRDLFTWYAKTRHDGFSSVISDHQKETQRHALAQPADPGLYCGILAPSTAVIPAPVSGLWYPSRLLATSPDIEHAKVVLHVPGGAFVLALGQDIWGRLISRPLLESPVASHVLFAQYRVAFNTSTRFPAAIQDMLTCYHYVLSLGVHPKNIILSGDSAGGNLTLSLLRYLETLNSDTSSPTTLPLPGGAMLWSPWVHVTPQAGSDFASSRNSTSDSIVPEILEWGVEAYFPQAEPTAEELAYISPLHHPFYTKVPLFIHAGGVEGFFEPIREFAGQMAGVDGNRVRFHSTDLVVHDLLMGYDGAGLDKEIQTAVEDAARFFES
ncbi:Alpha/Beta hydrolase protein [Xylaria venustula]|nr:Alpha/Beta hydrolase protein [Xylaria venustula]